MVRVGQTETLSRWWLLLWSLRLLRQRRGHHGRRWCSLLSSQDAQHLRFIERDDGCPVWHRHSLSSSWQLIPLDEEQPHPAQDLCRIHVVALCKLPRPRHNLLLLSDAQ